MTIALYGVAGLIFGVTSRFGFISAVGGVHPRSAGVAPPPRAGEYLGNSPVPGRDFAAAVLSRICNARYSVLDQLQQRDAMPTAIATAEQNLGIPPQIAGFCPAAGKHDVHERHGAVRGYHRHLPREVFGVSLNLGQMIAVMIMAVLTVVGAAGVPGGLDSAIGRRADDVWRAAEGIAIVLGVDRISTCRARR
jgi:hypothetical protein